MLFKPLNKYTVALFGQSYIENFIQIESELFPIVDGLIREKEFVEFLVGRNGDFDILSASVVKKARNQFQNCNSDLTLILPYITSEYKNNKKYLEEYYNNIEISFYTSKNSFNTTYYLRNCEMIDRADLVICYINKNTSAAHKAFVYAKKAKKNIINIGNL